MKYKFNEDKIIEQIKSHVDDTYNQHYAHGKYQATDMIVDSGHGKGFVMGNIMKYAMRYGKKQGHSDLDLFKIIHYAIIAIHLNYQDWDGEIK
jgi:hypothetical protein|tara:strand:+ start:158 stop:436 length:279 start_codon:yes stop_codon:yes gene_type:complete